MKNIFFAIAGALITTAGWTNSVQAAGLTNYSFEESSSFLDLNRYTIVDQDTVSGWQTTDSGIEIWGDGYKGVAAGEGDYFAEINAHINGSIFQDVSDIGKNQEVGFSFLHRARSGTDVMNLAITDLGLDNLFGTDDDTALFNKDYSATTEEWILNTSQGEEKITTLGNNMRFAYSAVSTGSGNASIGNFLDAANFGLTSIIFDEEDNKQEVPEPTSIMGLLLLGCAGFQKIAKRKLIS